MQTWKVSFVVVCACALFACPAPSGQDGGTGGGAAATGGGSGATGGGSGATGGGEAATGGGAADAGIDCGTVSLDPALGTLTLRTGATVEASVALPVSYAVGGIVDGQVYGLNWSNELVPLGVFPTLSAGAPVSIVDPADLADGGSLFASMFVATRHTEVAAGYTRASDFSGEIFVLETADGGVRRLDANGNFAMASLGDTWLVNGLSLDTAGTGAALYAMDGTGAYTFASFPANASSGYVAVLGDGTVVAGYADSMYTNHLHAAPPSLYGATLTSRVPFALADAPELSFGSDYVSYVVAAGDTLVLGRSAPGAFTLSRVETLPLDGGAPQPLLEAVDSCTGIGFVAGSAEAVWVNVLDRVGARLLKVRP